MASEENRNKRSEEENEEEFEISPDELVVDPYTGELVLAAEDGDKFDEIVPVDTGDRSGEEYLLEEETSIDYLAADDNAEGLGEDANSFTDEEEIEDVFEDRQQLGVSGRKELKEELEVHNSKSPQLSGDDIDAQWQAADVSGEETVGGTTPTPDQDIVEELGEALGITYDDDEPLHTEDKLRDRDEHRWELNPASADDELDREESDEDEVDREEE